MNQVWQFGSKSEEEINAEIEANVSNNTKKTRESIWKQFSRLHSFVKNYRWDHYWYIGIADTISTSGNIRSNFLKPW
jgi:hypothetical protein